MNEMAQIRKQTRFTHGSHKPDVGWEARATLRFSAARYRIHGLTLWG